MCGIFAILQSNSSHIQTSIKNCLDTLHHRGPDEEGYFFENELGIALGHKRLSILDLKNGKQPIFNEQKNIVLIFNGEIYNYLELRHQLIQRGHSFRTNTDTEVIIHLYEDLQENCLEQLNGMFAFILIDLEKRKLLAARDRFGIKPLYYTKTKDVLLFSSEIKALLAYPDIKREPNYNSIHEYLNFQFSLNNNTFFKNIHKLLPGTYIYQSLNNKNIKPKPYWQLSFNIDFSKTEDNFKTDLLILLDESVKMHLRSDVEVGSHLSGGLDSSTILALSSRHYKTKAFHGYFLEGDSFSEFNYAKEVAQKYQAELYTIIPTQDDFINKMPEIIYYMDEPMAGPGVFAQYMLCKKISEYVKVVLGGQGGDELFGGYARYLIAYLEQCIKGVIYENHEESNFIITFDSISAGLPQLKNYQPLMQQFFANGLFDPMEKRYFHLINRGLKINSFLTKDFIENYSLENIFENFLKLFNKTKTKSYFNKMTAFDIQTLLPALLHIEDRTSMAFSVESRIPFLDHRIFELVSQAPPKMKFFQGQQKYLLKQSVKDLLPNNILNRKNKMGFPVPIDHWYRDKVKLWMKDILLSSKSKNRNIYDTRIVENLLAENTPYSRELWGLLNLELWFQTFIDK